MNETPASITDEQLNERSMLSIKRQQRGLKLLTGTALSFWLVAMAGSLFIIWAYLYMYLPKDREIANRLGRDRWNASTDTLSSTPIEKARADERQVMFVMTRAVGVGTVGTAASVAVLSAGMLATIVLVIWNRRVTLRQINANLRQISAQLRDLEAAKR